MTDSSPVAHIEAWLAQYTQPQTRRAFKSDLDCWVGWCNRVGVDPLHPTPQDATRWVNWLCTPSHTIRGHPNRRYSAATVCRRSDGLARFFAYLIRVGELHEPNPLRGVRRPKLADESSTPILSAAEIQLLLNAAESDSRLAAAVTWTLAATGMRVGELYRADLRDLGEDEIGLTLRVVLKGGQPKQVALPPPVDDFVQMYVASRPKTPSKALFVRRDGLRLRWHDVDGIIERMTRTAGVPRITAHGLRHSCATLMLDSGATLAEVQQQLGHKSVEATKWYDRARKHRERAAAYRFAATLAKQRPTDQRSTA